MLYRIISISLVVLLFACNDTKELKPVFTTPSIKTVRAEPLRFTNANSPIVASGLVDSKVDMIVSFKIGGIVNYLNVEEGSSVSKGQQLCGLIQTEINAQVKLAEQAVEKAQRDVERTTNLYRDTVGTLEQKQNAQTAYEVAQSQLEIARFNQSYASLSSPIRGKILKRFVEKGELVSPGQPIYQIAGAGGKGSQIIRVGLTDKEIVKIRKGQEAKVKFDALPNQIIPAFITEIPEVSNPRSGLFLIELSLQGYHPKIKNGFIGKVEILSASETAFLEIPMSALVEGQNKKAKLFYTQDQEIAHHKEVIVLEIRDRSLILDKGTLPEDAWIVTAGAAYLSDQDSIKIIPETVGPDTQAISSK